MHATTRVNVEDAMLSEICQSGTDTCCMSPLTGGTQGSRNHGTESGAELARGGWGGAW